MMEKRPLTALDLEKMPPDGFRHELLDGELLKMPRAGFFHGYTGIYLTVPLASFVEAHDLGLVFMAETGFKVREQPDTVLAPDIAFVAKSRLPADLTGRGFFPGAPDLAVEIISPSETFDEVDEKIKRYLENGARLVWIVRPKRRRIEVHRANGETIVLGETQSLDGENVLPGFALPVARVFR